MSTTSDSTVLKRDVLGRVTTTVAHREALLDEFERSGMKGVPFARLAGVNYQTFASWVQKRRRQRGDYRAMTKAEVTPLNSPCEVAAQPLITPRFPRFLEVVMPPAASPIARSEAASPIGLEVELPGGAKLTIHSAQDAALAATLLNALRTPC
jgi:hypothetical protein